MSAQLVIHYPGGRRREVELADRPLVLGRSESCDVPLPGEEVSREHAHVWLDEDGRVIVADRRSKNGTRVDGGEAFRNAARVAARSIRIGEYEIEVRGGREADAPGATSVRFRPDPPSAIGQRSFYPSTPRLDLSAQRLSLLMSLAERIGGAFERKQLLEQALDACCDALGFERGLLALKTARHEPETPIVRNVQQDETGAYTVSRTLINRALLHGECAVVNDPAVDLVGNISESLVRFPICSALCVPIMHREEILGVIYGDRVTQGATYTPGDKDFLAAIARQVGVGLTNLRMFERHAEMQKVEQELQQARTIQRRLLPATALHAGRVTVAGYNEPSSAVGGDYFDYFLLPDGRVGLIIADVTGHGLPAALVMANLQAAVHVALTDDVPLPDLAARLNRLICRNTGDGVFVTAIVGRLEPHDGVLEYVNAGHPAPLLLGAGGVEPHGDGYALPLGVDPEERFSVQRIEPGREGLQAALFYTDGLVEAPDAGGAMLELAPVIQALRAAPGRTADDLLHTALKTISGHLGSAKNPDDLTLLALEWAEGVKGLRG